MQREAEDPLAENNELLQGTPRKETFIIVVIYLYRQKKLLLLMVTVSNMQSCEKAKNQSFGIFFNEEST